MRKDKINFISYSGRFILTYLFTVTLAALLFVGLQDTLPAESRVAIDFFEPFKVGVGETVLQALRALVMALVLYPFYNLIISSKRGLWLLFAAVWGLVLFASMEPKPGTIEGMIYTHTTLFEHLIVMAVTALQVIVFSLLFLRWEKRVAQAMFKGNALNDEKGDTLKSGFLKEKGYYVRFTLLHILVYMVVGSIFYQVAGYEEALASMEEFTLWRDLQSLGMVAAVFLGQIARGAIIAMLVAPFYDVYINQKRGWLQLYGLLFGLKVMVVLIVAPEMPFNWSDLVIGIPEIIVQTFVFSVLFFAWERRRINKLQIAGSLKPAGMNS